ncbi:MAG: type II secretion system protein [Campylobacter sp.]|uniref:type II secretion system protein n=1 Tax=Campylobacter sp. TaxID=205 RepID=UPI00360B9295
MVKTKKGFSLIELILAIVIMGLTMAAVPNIFSTVSDNNKMALIQETVMDAKTRLAIISTAAWSCTGEDSYQRLPTPVFGDMTNFYDQNNIPQEGRRIFSPIARTGVACNAWENRAGVLASFNNRRTQITSTAGYDRDSIITANLISNVNLSRNMNGTVNQDVREVSVNATTRDASGAVGYTIILRSYSANIGDAPVILTKVW